MSLEMTHQLRISAGWREDTGLLIVSEISRHSLSGEVEEVLRDGGRARKGGMKWGKKGS